MSMDAATARAVSPLVERIYRFRCPCGAMLEGPADEVEPVARTDGGCRVALWMGQGGSGDLIAEHLTRCAQGSAVAYVEYV